AGFKRYLELLGTEPDIVDKPGAVAVDHLRGDIAFEDVRFSYSDRLPVLEGVNLKIAAAETVAFVGPSGAGTTTIASLLPRFYDLRAARISLDGIDVRDMTTETLRRQIGIVQQDVFLFAGTLRDNTAYGKLGASDEEILEAARRA